MRCLEYAGFSLDDRETQYSWFFVDGRRPPISVRKQGLVVPDEIVKKVREWVRSSKTRGCFERFEEKLTEEIGATIESLKASRGGRRILRDKSPESE